MLALDSISTEILHSPVRQDKPVAGAGTKKVILILAPSLTETWRENVARPFALNLELSNTLMGIELVEFNLNRTYSKARRIRARAWASQ